MLITFLLTIIVTVVNFLFSFLPLVTTLPFGLSATLSTAYGLFHGAAQIAPFLSTLMKYAMFAVSIEIAYSLYKTVNRIVNWIRGSG